MISLGARRTLSQFTRQTTNTQNLARYKSTMTDQIRTATWGIRINSSDVTKLRAGYTPKDMDERWGAIATETGSEGRFECKVARSWGGADFNILTVKPEGDGGVIESIGFASKSEGKEVSAEQRKAFAVTVCNALMGTRLGMHV